MKKKILSLVLVVAMLASMLVFAPVSGATEAPATVAIGTATAAAGQTVSVDVVLTSAADVQGYTFAYEYDTTRLKKTGITFKIAGGAESPDLSNGPSYVEVTKSGPFEVFSWTVMKEDDVLDCTKGLLVATIDFEVLENAPLGDAFVAVRDLSTATLDFNEVYVLDAAAITGADIATVDGKVTVLPADYIDPNAGNPNDFTASATGKVSAYNGTSTGTVVIPKQGKRTTGALKDLKAIAAEALYGTPFTTLIIPAHITSIEEAAIFDPAVEALKIIVLGEATAFAEAAVLIDESDCVVTICGYAGSTAEAYAESEGYDFEALDLCSLAVGDASYFVPANTEIAVPGVSATADGKVVVGWSDGAKTYAPGAAMTLTGDAELTAVTIDAIQMNTGVGFKMGATIDKCQMRFTTNMAIADYEKLAALGTVTLGTIITPAKYVSMAGGLTKEALTQLAIEKESVIGALPDGKTGAGLTYIDVPASAAVPFGKTADTYTFAGSLAGFRSANSKVEYAAAFYATVTIDENTSFTIYSAFDFGANRTVESAITAMTGVSAAEYGLTNEEAKTLRDLIAGN